MSLDELATTRSDEIRNRLAMDHSDARTPGLAQAIGDAIRNHPLPRNFGTPVFVLNEIKGSLPLSLAVKALLSGSFETKVEVLELLLESRFTASPGDVSAAVDALAGIDPNSSLGHDIGWVVAGLRRLTPAQAKLHRQAVVGDEEAALVTEPPLINVLDTLGDQPIMSGADRRARIMGSKRVCDAVALRNAMVTGVANRRHHQ